MIHTTNHGWSRGGARIAFRSFGTLAARLVVPVLICVTGQNAMAAALGINTTANLVFGRYATTPSQGGTVTIDPATGGKSVTGALFDFGDAHQRAQYDVTGDPDAAFSITLPSQITINKGGNDITIDPVTSSPSGSGVLDGTGNAQLYVGGTLTLSANQASGSYGGNFSITVDYQ